MTTVYLEQIDNYYKLGVTENPNKLKGNILRTYTHVEAYYLKLGMKDKLRSQHIKGDYYKYINPKWFDEFTTREGIQTILDSIMLRKAKGLPIVRNKKTYKKRRKKYY